MADLPPTLRWRTSSRSGGGNQCVEIAVTRDEAYLRDSKNRTGGHIELGPVAWRALLAATK